MLTNKTLLLALVAGLLINPMAAIASDDVGQPPVKGVQWTKIQDLNAGGKAKNRPIKQKWAVVIGAAKFKEKRLEGQEASMDVAAKEFYDYLVDPNGGRFIKDHVKLLVNEGATRANIITALGEPFLGRLVGPDDLVVVFIATNGFPTTDGSTYLCAYDCALDNVYATCVSMQNLMDTLKHEVHSDRILLVLESCYSGAADLSSGAKALFKNVNIDLEKVALGNGYMILSSSKPDQMTLSPAFSHYLVQALRQQNGLIPIADAFEKAKEETETATATGQGRKQTPVLKSSWVGNELVLGAPSVDQVSDIPDAVKNFLSAEGMYLKATQLMAQGNLAEAAKSYEAALTVDPGYSDVIADYGALKAINGDWQGAKGLYEKAIAQRPNDELYHANYARILSQLGDQDKSMEELKKANQLNPNDRIVLTALANRYEKTEPAQAVSLLRQAVDLYPSSSDLRQRLCLALMRNHDTDGAMIEAQKAVSLEPTSAVAKLNLGSVLLAKGNRPGAIGVYKEAVKLAPDNANAHYLLSKTLESAGETADARVELSKFVDLCPEKDVRLEAARRHLTELSQAR